MAEGFRYTARSGSGEIVRGTMVAPDAGAVLAALQTRALFVTRIDADRTSAARVARLWTAHRPSRRALLAFFRSFSTLIRAGVPVERALEVTIRRSTDRALREALAGALADVRHGVSLSDALACRPRSFPAVQVAMIAAGEAGGILDDVLERAASLYERDAELRKKIRSALAYPVVVLIAACALALFLVVQIVPMFATLFDSFHADLPWSTRLLLGAGRALQSPPVWIAAGFATLVSLGALRRYATSGRGAYVADRIRLALPLAGSLLHKSIVARVARTLGTLMRSGIELVRAIDVIIPMTGSNTYASALTAVAGDLREGAALSDALAAAKLFDPFVLALVHAGEETGLVDDMLFKLSAFFESDVEAAIATLGAVTEPLLIAALGLIVGFIVFSIFIPLYSLIGSVSQ